MGFFESVFPCEVIDMICDSLVECGHFSFDLVEFLSILDAESLLDRVERLYKEKFDDWVLKIIFKNQLCEVSEKWNSDEESMRRSVAMVRKVDGFCYLSMFEDFPAWYALRLLGPNPELHKLTKVLLGISSLSDDPVLGSLSPFLHESVLTVNTEGALHSMVCGSEAWYIDFHRSKNVLTAVSSDSRHQYERGRKYEKVVSFYGDAKCGSSVNGLFSDRYHPPRSDSVEDESVVSTSTIKPQRDSSILPSDSASQGVTSEMNTSDVLRMFDEMHTETVSLRSELASLSVGRDRIRELWKDRLELDQDLNEAVEVSGTHMVDGYEREIDSIPRVSTATFVHNHTTDKRLNFLISIHNVLYKILGDETGYPCEDFMTKLSGLMTRRSVWEEYDSQHLDLLLIVLSDTFDFRGSRIKNNRFCLPGIEVGMRVSEMTVAGCLTSLSSEYNMRWKNSFKDVVLPRFVCDTKWNTSTLRMINGEPSYRRNTKYKERLDHKIEWKSPNDGPSRKETEIGFVRTNKSRTRKKSSMERN